jgi:hypothetical protein
MKQLYKGFKKIAEDNDSAKLVHENGHELIISKKGLSKQLQYGLNDLPLHQYDGTPPALDFVSDDQWQQQTQPQAQQQPAKTAQNKPLSYKVGKAIKEEVIQPAVQDLMEGYVNPLLEYNNRLGRSIEQNVIEPSVEFGKGLIGVGDSQAAEREPQAEPQGNIVPTSVNAPSTQTQATPPSGLAAQTPEAQPAQAEMPSGMPNYGQLKPGEVPQEMQGLPGFGLAMSQYPQIAKAQQAEAERQAQVYRNAAEASRMNQRLFEDSHQELQNDINDTLKRIENQEVKPNHYLESMSTGQKIMIAIGGLIAGAGAGALHQENPVYKFLNSQIERDLNAQKANMENQNNLFNHLSNKYRNDMVAENMFRVMRAETLANEIAEAAANSKLAQAQPNARLAQAELMRQYMPFYQSAVAMNAFNKLGQMGAGQQMTMGGVMPAQQQMNIASKQAAALLRSGQINEAVYQNIIKEIEEQSKSAYAHQEIDRIMNGLAKEQSLGRRALSPVQSAQAIANYKAELYPLIQSADPAKRLSQQEIETELAPFAGSIMTSEKTRELFRENAHNLVHSVTKPPATSAGFNIAMPRYVQTQPQLEYAYGKYWKKVPGGRIEVRTAKGQP